jgi:lipopolysaccharide biosynthesis glycosyltransferase
MNIIYSCDNNYSWLAGISMLSLFENNKHIEILDVYIFIDNVEEENCNKLMSISRAYNRRLELINIKDLDISEQLYTKRWPKSAYARLYAVKLLPNNIKSALYLDCDTIVLGDLSYFANENFEEHIVYGVKDCISGGYKRNIGLKSNATYINSGIIVLNMEKWRKLDITSIVSGFYEKFGDKSSYADQGFINGAFSNDIGVLDLKYNVITLYYMYSYKEVLTLRHPTNFYDEKEFNNAKSNPVIIHYTTFMRIIRPWFKGSQHPYAKSFDDYLFISPWKNKIKENMVFHTKESSLIQIAHKLPKYISLAILGFSHSTLKPWLIRYKIAK